MCMREKRLSVSNVNNVEYTKKNWNRLLSFSFKMITDWFDYCKNSVQDEKSEFVLVCAKADLIYDLYITSLCAFWNIRYPVGTHRVYNEETMHISLAFFENYANTLNSTISLEKGIILLQSMKLFTSILRYAKEPIKK